MEKGMPGRSIHPDAWSEDGVNDGRMFHPSLTDGSALFNPQHFGAHEVAPRSGDGSLAHWRRLDLVIPKEWVPADFLNIDSVVDSALRQLGERYE
jgi:hypothetical protein